MVKNPLPLGWLGLPYKYSLAVQPLYSGLLANTVIYAGAIALLLACLRPPIQFTRRFLRRRRGLCPRCAYSLTGLAPDSPCPECGSGSLGTPP